MKKMWSLILTVMLIVAMLVTGAMAEVDAPQENAPQYTHVPGVETQDTVLSLIARAIEQTEEAETSDYIIQVQQPTELSARTLTQLLNAVQINVLPAVSCFDEEVQAEIQLLLPEGMDADALYMTEFMSLLPEAWESDARIEVEVQFDVDYQPSQVVVAVIGVENEEGAIEWKPLAAEVRELGLICFEIPAEWHQKIKNVETLFAVLTDRIGDRGDVVEGDQTQTTPPSKTAGDLVQIPGMSDAEGNELPEEFRIFSVDETEDILNEIAMIQAHLEETVEKPAEPIFSYFDADMQNRIRLLLPEDVDMEGLLAYEVLPVMAEGYQETYGDAMVSFVFATPYTQDQQLVVALGQMKESCEEGEDPMEWTALRAMVVEDQVNIIFSQAVIPQMQQEAALMIVLSTPIQVEAAE